MKTAELLLVRFSEIGLKGKNRGRYLRQLVSNLRQTMRDWPGRGAVRATRNRILIALEEPARTAGPARQRIMARLADTPGVRSFSPARALPLDLEAIAHAAVELAREAAGGPLAPRTFAVRASRSDKRFAHRSIEIERAVGARVRQALPQLGVELGRPELELGIEIHPEAAYLFDERLDAPGGLPVGSSGGVVHLLSGGLDSPVAAWRLQLRGVSVYPLYFHSFPFTGDAARLKVLELARVLAQRQPRLVLHIAPFTAVQTALREACDPAMLVVLYRRMMLRVAERLATALGLQALASGDSVGQVASQTLANLRTIDQVSTLPVLRPLCGTDKEETIALARRLGTYEISTRPAADCCSLFVPRHPRTRTSPEQAERQERRVDVPALIAACLEGLERVVFEGGHPQHEPSPLAG
ncbi:MAG: putative tRNA sulfurtransferase [Planctomycetota bacterium]|nr:MAG: putative tRNA sulfurtransferase [Planctomycetota bacterium]